MLVDVLALKFGVVIYEAHNFDPKVGAAFEFFCQGMPDRPCTDTDCSP